MARLSIAPTANARITECHDKSRLMKSKGSLYPQVSQTSLNNEKVPSSVFFFFFFSFFLLPFKIMEPPLFLRFWNRMMAMLGFVLRPCCPHQSAAWVESGNLCDNIIMGTDAFLLWV
ncbi:hypothetical protein BDV27DRAFT_48638 [Aspergillus caelatus]|uniref:Uncharacterized protein n=1 Tax=Aspergillus caelatus TaxID=61420 RepID=A0A5N7AEM6_9EURO|nr:uncharacterized protein BDV27DRAFT_48638 [Aspergillus caelatus]KAE8368324.1 hypothetical protein BDV27DRAFT_48638 [Aspergillus caelatus]